MPLSSADSTAYNSQFLGLTSEATLEQYCAWLSDPYVAPEYSESAYSTSSEPLVDPDNPGKGALRLDQQSYITEAPTSLVDPDFVASDHDVVCLLMRKLDYDVFTGPVTHIYATQLRRGDPYPYGVKLVRRNGKWSAVPELLDPSFYPFLQSVRVKSPWLTGLLKVNRSVLRPLFLLGQRTGQDAHNEAQILINHFLRIGPQAYFENLHQALAWECCAHWYDWEAVGLDVDSRIGQLSSQLGQKCSKELYHRIIPSALGHGNSLVLLQESPFEADVAIRQAPPVTPCADKDRQSGENQASNTTEDSESIPDLPLKVLLAEERALFSTGGSYNLHFKSTTATLVNGTTHDFWWWRGYVNRTWSEEKIRVFADNWVWSAFAYELFAREKYPMQWLVSGRPWNKLTFSMRALLQSALNIDVRGPSTLRARVAERLNPDEPDLLYYVADLRLAKAKLLADFEASIDSKKAEKASKRHSDFPRLPWKVLEFLDESHLMNLTLDDTQRSEVSKAKAMVKNAWNRMVQRVGSLKAPD